MFTADSVYIMNLQLDQREQTPKVYDLEGNADGEKPVA